jgi:hypothetical protein
VTVQSTTGAVGAGPVVEAGLSGAVAVGAVGLLESPLDAVDARRAYRARELLAQRCWSDEQRRELRQALAHRAPSDPASWTDRQLKRQARDEQRQLQR